jgi:hypothetical protein
MNRRVINVALSGTAIAGFISTFGPRILKLLRLEEDAEALRHIFIIVRGWDVNWTGLWFLAFIFSGLGLLAFNWALIARLWQRLSEARERKWDRTGAQAVNYIAVRSYYSISLPDNPKAKLEESKRAFMEAAHKGKLRLGARPAGSSLLRKLSKREVKKHKFQFQDAYGGNELEGDTKLINRKKETAYSSVFVDQRELKSLWPASPSSLY